jgi:hypothetical protein
MKLLELLYHLYTTLNVLYSIYKHLNMFLADSIYITKPFEITLWSACSEGSIERIKSKFFSLFSKLGILSNFTSALLLYSTYFHMWYAQGLPCPFSSKLSGYFYKIILLNCLSDSLDVPFCVPFSTSCVQHLSNYVVIPGLYVFLQLD